MSTRNQSQKAPSKQTAKQFARRAGSETDTELRSELRSLEGRLMAAKRRVRYHCRPGHGASRTVLSAGEAKDLARADVLQLTHFIETIRAKIAKSPNGAVSNGGSL